MAEFNSDVLSTREVRPERNATTRLGDGDKLDRLSAALDYEKLAQHILDAGVFTVNWDQLATVGAGTTTTLSYDVRFPVIIHGVSFVNTAAALATADVKLAGVSILDAAQSIAAGTLVEVKPENDATKYEADRGETITIELIADAGAAIATPRVGLTLQRR